MHFQRSIRHFIRPAHEILGKDGRPRVPVLIVRRVGLRHARPVAIIGEVPDSSQGRWISAIARADFLHHGQAEQSTHAGQQ